MEAGLIDKMKFTNTMFISLIGGNENLKALVNECILMKKLKHPNVLPVLGMCLESSHENGLPFMIMPFMLNGDLKSYLKKKRKKPGQVDQLPEVPRYTYNNIYVNIMQLDFQNRP